MNTQNTTTKTVVKRAAYFIPLTSLFDKKSFRIANYGVCNGNNNKFITLNEVKRPEKRVVTLISKYFVSQDKYGAYKRSMLYYTYDGTLKHNIEIEIYGKKFIVLDKRTKKGDFYVIKSDTHRLVGFLNETRKVIKFPNICL